MQALEAKLRDATTPPNRIIAGAVLATYDGHTHYAKTYGDVSVEQGAAPMQTDTVMRFASCTKLMTTVAALQCVGKRALHSR